MTLSAAYGLIGLTANVIALIMLVMTHILSIKTTEETASKGVVNLVKKLKNTTFFASTLVIVGNVLVLISLQ